MPPAKSCTVSFKGPSGITHSVDVAAHSLYEAAAMGVAALKKDGWVEGLGPGTRLVIRVRESSGTHSVTVQQLTRWLDGASVSPAEVLRRAQLKKLLA
jgi:hypothetical protein